MRIGIYGGSFNPIHNGHIAIAREVIARSPIDEIWFMVSPENPFKTHDSDLLDEQLRLELTREALCGEAKMLACDYEFRLPRPSYTWNTLQHLSADYPQHRFTLLIGGDNWAHFSRWRHAEEILTHYEIIVYSRTGYDTGTAQLPPTVSVIDTRRYDISSTEIRRRIRCGLPTDDMLPPSIAPLARRYYSCTK